MEGLTNHHYHGMGYAARRATKQEVKASMKASIGAVIVEILMLAAAFWATATF